MEVTVTASQGPLRSLPKKLEALLLLLDGSKCMPLKGDRKRIRLLKSELEQLISEYLMEPSDRNAESTVNREFLNSRSTPPTLLLLLFFFFLLFTSPPRRTPPGPGRPRARPPQPPRAAPPASLRRLGGRLCSGSRSAPERCSRAGPRCRSVRAARGGGSSAGSAPERLSRAGPRWRSVRAARGGGSGAGSAAAAVGERPATLDLRRR